MWLTESFVVDRVSVIIPTHNRSALIEQTLASVYAQTHNSIEILVVDDGSTDDTKTVVRRFAQDQQGASSTRLHYLRQKKSGAQYARNLGCQHATGEFIQFLDSDDLMHPEKIARQLCAMRSSECDATYGPWQCIYGFQEVGHNAFAKQGPTYQSQPLSASVDMLYAYLSATWFVPVHSYLFRRSTIQKTGCWDVNLKRRQDADYVVRSLINSSNFVWVPDAEVYYRRHGTEHIGRSTNFPSHFPSILSLIKKQANLLAEWGKEKIYEDALLLALARLSDEAWVVGCGHLTPQCLEVARNLYGDEGADAISELRQSKLNLIARRFVSHPLRRVAGEYLSQRFSELVLGRAA